MDARYALALYVEACLRESLSCGSLSVVSLLHHSAYYCVAPIVM